MMAAKLALGLLALVGHAALWIALVNRVHATALPRWTIKTATLFFYFLLAGGGLAALAWIVAPGWSAASWLAPPVERVLWGYLVLCTALAAVQLPRWFYERTHWRKCDALLRQRTTSADIAAQLGTRPVRGAIASLLTRIPGNELLHLDAHERVLLLDRLPESLEGLSILHLSDLHFSGRVERTFFHEVMDAANRLDSDLVVLTGDICDKASCIDWIVPLLGKLRARHGKFFVLGNHDLRVKDIDRLRDALKDAGFVDLGSTWQLVEVRGARILLAGNELPWIAPAADLRPGHAGDGEVLRVLLAHSPDQFDWARAFDFDLMFAGHTHGGQIRLPYVGSVLCPSWFGTRYACGTFQQGSTVMHVSRGISSLTPVRFNCPPEIIKLVLTGGRLAEEPAVGAAPTATI